MEVFFQQSAFLWVQTESLFSPTCSFFRLRHTSYSSFSLNSSRFGDFVDRTYSIEIKDTIDTVRTASYLDLHLDIDSEGRLRTTLQDKGDEFNVFIVNFPFICSNIPAVPVYGIFISQLIRYSRVSGSYQDCLDRGLLLTMNLLIHKFLLVKMKSSFRMFYGHHHDLVNCYGISV